MDAFKKIKNARKELGFTQTDLAKALGLSQNDVSKLESGRKKFIPNKYILFLMEKGYDINSIFNDKLPLRKLPKDSPYTNVGQGNASSGNDLPLKDKVMRLLGLSDEVALDEFLSHMDAPDTMLQHPLEKLFLMAWEKKYLSKFNSLVRQMEIYEEEVFELAPERIEAVRMKMEENNNGKGAV